MSSNPNFFYNPRSLMDLLTVFPPPQPVELRFSFDTSIDYPYLEEPVRQAVAVAESIELVRLHEIEDVLEALNYVEFNNGFEFKYPRGMVLIDAPSAGFDGGIDEDDDFKMINEKFNEVDFSEFTVTLVNVVWEYRSFDGVYEDWILIQYGKDVSLPPQFFAVEDTEESNVAATVFIEAQLKEIRNRGLSL